jgi:hypothetical protein
MTIPHLMNCAHADSGWCLECVKALHDERDRLRAALKFYADEENYDCPPETDSSGTVWIPIEVERGTRARAALEGR